MEISFAIANQEDEYVLTELRNSDRRELVERINDPEIHRFTLRIPHPYTEADFDHWMERVAAATEHHGEPAHFAIRRQTSLIGCCGFEDIEFGSQAELGYWVAKSCWGQGVATAAVRAACAHAFATWRLARIVAHVMPTNPASARVLEKNGFQFLETLQDYHVKDGQPIASCRFVLTRPASPASAR